MDPNAALAQSQEVLTVEQLRSNAHFYEATLDSLEHILFGNVQKRSRDNLESRAAEAICAWNEKRN